MSTTSPDRIAENRQVAQTIYNQLGNRRFSVMTGCKVDHLLLQTDRPGLVFRIPKNQSRATHFSIRLDPSDTYTLRFYRFLYSPSTGADKQLTVRRLTDVYCDQLQRLFTDVTGLDTYL